MTMPTIAFADTGLQVSRMCLGTMNFGDRTDAAETARIVATGLAGGVNFLDTASMYSAGKSEELLAPCLRGQRDRFFLATKVNVPTGAEYPAQIGPSLEASLKRLDTDYVDMYLLHWPRAGMDPVAIMSELAKVVKAGKARYIGCCNFPAWLFAHFNAVAARIGGPRLINNQIPYNLIERGPEVELLPQAVAERVAITCYRPLLAGALSDRYTPDAPPPPDSRAVRDKRLPTWQTEHAQGIACLRAMAQRQGVPTAFVAVAWLCAQPGLTCPIIGVSRLAQITENLRAFEHRLSAAEISELNLAFGTEVKEVSQTYGPLRRAFGLTVQ